MKPLLDLSVGLDRAQSPHQCILKSNIQHSTINQLSDDSQFMHYYGININIFKTICFISFCWVC